MAGYSWDNEYPMELGGGPTLAERHYDALRRAPGKGGVAEDEEDSIDAVWRQCKAQALANLDAMAEHAALQVFPLYAEELLYYYEDLFALVPDPDATLVERQQAAHFEWLRISRADGPALTEALARIDARMGLLEQEYDTTATTHDGKMVRPHDGYFGGPGSSFPNYSDDFTVYVLFDLGNGVQPGLEDHRKIERARRLLHFALPTWVDFEIQTATGSELAPTPGFQLDVSLLDLTAFGA